MNERIAQLKEQKEKLKNDLRDTEIQIERDKRAVKTIKIQLKAVSDELEELVESKIGSKVDVGNSGKMTTTDGEV